MGKSYFTAEGIVLTEEDSLPFDLTYYSLTKEGVIVQVEQQMKENFLAKSHLVGLKEIGAYIYIVEHRINYVEPPEILNVWDEVYIGELSEQDKFNLKNNFELSRWD